LVHNVSIDDLTEKGRGGGAIPLGDKSRTVNGKEQGNPTARWNKKAGRKKGRKKKHRRISCRLKRGEKGQLQERRGKRAPSENISSRIRSKR